MSTGAEVAAGARRAPLRWRASSRSPSRRRPRAMASLPQRLAQASVHARSCQAMASDALGPRQTGQWTAAPGRRQGQAGRPQRRPRLGSGSDGVAIYLR